MITQAQKIEKYERLLHLLQMYSSVTLEHEKVRQLLGNICQWSWAHRSGNGELSEEEQRAAVECEFHKLTELK